MQDEPISSADRIAVTNLFREIAAFGRQVRERRVAEAAVAQTTAIVDHSLPVPDKNRQEVPAG